MKKYLIINDISKDCMFYDDEMTYGFSLDQMVDNITYKGLKCEVHWYNFGNVAFIRLAKNRT